MILLPLSSLLNLSAVGQINEDSNTEFVQPPGSIVAASVSFELYLFHLIFEPKRRFDR